jgi:hypothetical protein
LPQCSERAQELFAQGLNVIASLRPTAAELLGHLVFNFGKLLFILAELLYKFYKFFFLEIQ